MTTHQSAGPQPATPEEPQDVETNPSQPTEETRQPESSPPKRRKHWGRRIAILFVILLLVVGGLVAAGPWLLSQPAARSTILGIVNDRIPGELRFDSVSLSWFDDVEIDGLKLFDIDKQEVVSAKRVYLGSGLANVASNPTRFAELQIDEPDIHVRMNQNNQPTLVGALTKGRSRTKASSNEKSELPEVVGKLVIKNGRVRVTTRDGKTQTVSDINADVNLQSLDQIKGTLGFTTEGGSLSADADVQNLTKNGAFDVSNARGKVKVATNGECELGPLLAMVMPKRAVTGRGTLSVDADFEPGGSRAVVDAHVWDVYVKDSANAEGAPLDVTCKGNLAMNGTKLDGTVDLKGTPGEANVQFAADTDQDMPKLSADDILSALFGGKSIALPDFSLDATSRIDLAQVERALPGVLELQPGQVIRQGVVKVERLAVRGGASPTIEAAAQLTDGSVTHNGATDPISPMRVDLSAKIDEQAGLNVDRLKVDGGFGAIDASGTPHNLSCKFNGDLAAAKRDLSPFVDLGNVEMSGNVDGTLDLNRKSDTQVAIDSTVNASQARFRVGDKSFDLNQSTFAQGGVIDLEDNKPVKFRADSLRVDLDKQIVVSGSGSYDVASKAFDADLNVDRGDLSFLAQRADMLGAPDLKRFRGELSGSIKAKGTGAANIETSGNLAASQLTADGQPVLRDRLDIKWQDVNVRDNGQKLKIALASLSSQEATVDIKDADIDLKGGDKASGTIKANADLQGVFAAVARLSDMEKPPALKGTLKLDGDIQKSQSGFKFAANGGISQFEVGEGTSAVREDHVDMKLDATIDPKQKSIRLGTNELKSGLLNARIAGQIDRYDTDAVANLSGDYSTQWQAITQLIKELSPSTAKLVSIQGTSRSKISLNGPLNRKSDTPPYRGSTGAASVSWDKANIVGVDLSQAKIDLSMKNGEVIVAPTTIGAAQGRVNLASRYDIGSSTLRIPGRVATLDGVKFTPELSRELLSRINPVFYHVVSAEGNVNLTMNDLELPLEENARGGGGGGKLELKNAQIEPGGILGELVKLGLATTTGEKIAVGLEGADFKVHDGRIHYENFAMIFPYDFDLRFRGSVGFDDTVDLVVSIPVRPELLQRLGVKGPVVQYAQVLTGSRVDIPIAGTRENPKLQLSKVATDSLVKEAVKRIGEQGAGETIKGLTEGLLGGGNKADKGKGGKADKAKGGKKGGGKKKGKEKKKGIEGIIEGLGG